MKGKTLHRIIALVIVVVLSQQMFMNTFIVADFIIHQDYIAKNLCVQKDDQQGCNGKCHLHKTLEENKSDDSSPQENSPRFVVKLDYLYSTFKFDNELFFMSEKLIYKNRFSSKILIRYDEVLTPPPDFV